MWITAGVCLAVVVTASACATRGHARPAELAAPPAGARSQPPPDSTETVLAKARETSARARLGAAAQTVEASDPALASALLQLSAAPTPSRHRAVADEYVRLGILDKAHEHLSVATTIDPRDAAGWDGRARIWRDWGFLHLALADAHRARYFAPASAVAHNTLGTILQALGDHRGARTQYEKSLQLDPTAAYAMNNLCYSLLLDGRAEQAAVMCNRALGIEPGRHATVNNLGLAYAADGNLDAAGQTFALAGGDGRSQYNLGIAHLARREYADAVSAFEAAYALRPGFRAATLMARAARQLATNRSEP